MKKTALYNKHVELGAKMVPFAGFDMPVQYAGVTEEHFAVREKAGMFDVSHMGQFIIEGAGAKDLLQYVTTNDLNTLTDGKAQYSCLPNGQGGIVDDLIIYKMADKKYFVVVNASNIEKDWNHISKFNEKFGAKITNISDETSLIAIQGPLAAQILQKLTSTNLSEIPYYHFTIGTVDGVQDVIISNTGYTGSGGFEIYFKNENAEQLWNALTEAGKEEGLVPCGLAARDTLRLEKGFCLYGNDIDDSTSPLEAGLGWITKLGKGDFVDAEFFKKQKEQYNDKIYDQNQQEQTHKLEAQYENKRIKSEIEVVKEREKNRRIQNYLYISLAIMAVFLLILVRRNYANRMKLQAEKELRLQKEKQEAQAQALHKEKQRRLLSIQKIRVERESKLRILLEQEEQARLKEQQKLLRLKNDQMHKEALANALQIERKNQLLDEIRESIKAKETDVNIDTILKQEKRMEEALDQSVKEFQEIHPEFFSKLNALSDNKLTPLDLRYCAYIHLKLSTKELATIFNVEPKSIRMTKYRIKQKLNLDKEKDLEDFLQNIV